FMGLGSEQSSQLGWALKIVNCARKSNEKTHVVSIKRSSYIFCLVSNLSYRSYIYTPSAFQKNLVDC
ncbi:MAG: hypothetical protein ACREBU_25685, partial [Nitrososphaera sp.]